MDLRGILLPVAATPVLQAILNYAGLLKLSPFPSWGWSDNIIAPVTYIVAIGSAAIASIARSKSKSRKILLIVIGLAALLISLGFFTFFSNNPPRQGFLLIYDLGGYTSFFLTYMAFGFLVARVIKYFAQK